MTGKERQRKLAREHFERQQVERARKRAAAKRRNAIVGAATGVLLVAGGVGVAVLVKKNNNESDKAAAESSATPTPPKPVAFKPNVDPSVKDTRKPLADPGKAGCKYLDDAKSPKKKDVGRPPGTPDLTATKATIKTNLGEIAVDLQPTYSPCAVNSFAFLASKGYFNNSVCHRVTIEGLQVLQCGDPTAKGNGKPEDGDGSGGPGYRFAEENLKGAAYPAGTLAMAKTQEPSSTGSQFFIVLGDSKLDPLYTVFGKVSKGLNVAQSVAVAGTVTGEPDGAPKKKTVIQGVTIGKSS